MPEDNQEELLLQADTVNGLEQDSVRFESMNEPMSFHKMSTHDQK